MIKISFVITLIAYLIAFISGSFSYLLVATALLWLSLIIFSYGKRDRIAVLAFYFVIFLFYLGRPLLDLYSSYKYHTVSHYDRINGKMALLMITASMIFIFIGVLIRERYFYNSFKSFKLNLDVKKSAFSISLVLYIISYISSLFSIYEMFVFTRANGYFSLYSSFSSNLPFLIRALTSFLPATFVILVATHLSRKGLYTILVSYMINSGLYLFIGKRNLFSISIIFSIIIVLFDVIKKKKYILNKKTILISVIIFLIMFTSFDIIGNARFEKKQQQFFNPVFMFFYNQGISFTVLSRGYEYLEKINPNRDRFFTLNPITDYFKKDVNHYSKEYALNGNNFASSLAYELYDKRFIKGLGVGSSYIIELFYDGDFYLIAIFSLLLGMFLSVIKNLLASSILVSIITVRMLLEIFYIPRAPALKFIEPLIRLHFILPVTLILIISYLINRKAKKLIVISNIYPTKDKPYVGVFVRNFYVSLKKLNINSDIIYKKNSYLTYYMKILFKLLFLRFDRVYLHYPSHSALPLIIVKLFKNITLYTNLHGGDIFGNTKAQRYLRPLTIKLLKESEKIIVPSLFFKELLLDDIKLDNNIYVYPSGGINTDVFKEEIIKRKEEKIIVGFNARLVKEKGYDIAIDIVKNLKNVKLIIIGTGNGKKIIEEKIKKEKIENVELLGTFKQNELGKIYNKMDILLFPSRYKESLSLVVLEAMSCGVIVLTNNKGAQGSYVIDKVNGFIFDNSVEDGKDKLMKIINLNKEEKEKIKENAKKQAANYSNEKVSKTLEQIINN